MADWREWVVGMSKVSLSDVEWVVVDDADVLFGALTYDHAILRSVSDVQYRPRLYRPDAAPAKCRTWQPVPAISRAEPQSTPQASLIMPFDYPFNFILTYATIPAALSAHLEARHPDKAACLATATPPLRTPCETATRR
jgi:ATP-dependent RNA helicase MRH4